MLQCWTLKTSHVSQIMRAVSMRGSTGHISNVYNKFIWHVIFLVSHEGAHFTAQLLFFCLFYTNNRYSSLHKEYRTEQQSFHICSTYWVLFPNTPVSSQFSYLVTLNCLNWIVSSGSPVLNYWPVQDVPHPIWCLGSAPGPRQPLTR